MESNSYSRLLVCVLFFFAAETARSQFLMDMIDTSKSLGKGMLSMYERFNHVVISGYMQPQFQVASEEGTKTYNGGDFPPKSNNRFMLRRGRIKLEYARFNLNDQPVLHFAFQFDGTERGVF